MRRGPPAAEAAAAGAAEVAAPRLPAAAAAAEAWFNANAHCCRLRTCSHHSTAQRHDPVSSRSAFVCLAAALLCRTRHRSRVRRACNPAASIVPSPLFLCARLPVVRQRVSSAGSAWRTSSRVGCGRLRLRLRLGGPCCADALEVMQLVECTVVSRVQIVPVQCNSLGDDEWCSGDGCCRAAGGPCAWPLGLPQAHCATSLAAAPTATTASQYTHTRSQRLTERLHQSPRASATRRTVRAPPPHFSAAAAAAFAAVAVHSSWSRRKSTRAFARCWRMELRQSTERSSSSSVSGRIKERTLSRAERRCAGAEPSAVAAVGPAAAAAGARMA